MEKPIHFKTADNKIIYCKLNYKKLPAGKLIVFVHGLTGDMHEHIFFNAVKFFAARGFSTLRFNFYSSEQNARKLEECTLATHVEDLDLIVDKTFHEYDKVYVVGHSLAGPVILQSKLLNVIDKVVLWDPTLSFDWVVKKYRFNKELGVYFKRSSWYKPLGQEMFNELQNLDILKLYKNTQVPTKVIIAGENMYSSVKPLLKAVVNNNVLVTELQGASHNFDEEGTEEALFHATLDWIAS